MHMYICRWQRLWISPWCQHHLLIPPSLNRAFVSYIFQTELSVLFSVHIQKMANVDLGESRRGGLIAETCVVFPIALLAVALRFIARRRAKIDIWWDDWLILVATILNIGFTGVSFHVINLGLGKHVESLSPTTLVHFLQTYYAGQIFYVCTLVTVKLSILALYWRVFGHVHSIRVPLYSLLGLVVAWGLAAVRGRHC